MSVYELLANIYGLSTESEFIAPIGGRPPEHAAIQTAISHITGQFEDLVHLQMSDTRWVVHTVSLHPAVFLVTVEDGISIQQHEN